MDQSLSREPITNGIHPVTDAINSHGPVTNGFHPTDVNGTQAQVPSVNGDSGPSVQQQIPVAIVGLACRLPGRCNSPQALWDFISKGSIANNTPPKTRFNLTGHYDGSGRPGTMPSPGGMFLEDVDPAAFDSSFFNTSVTEATSMDPQQRLMLEVTYEALENSGITLDKIRGANIGCLVGNNTCEYEGGFVPIPEDQAPGGSTGCSRSILSNRVSHFLDINGPSLTIDTACSSTLIGVDMACRYLQFHQADGMLVGGSLMYLDPLATQDRGPMGEAFSKTGKCHTFDAKADGYIRAEGINAVYLKRLDDAIRDGDPIRAVIRGSAVNSDGRTPGLTYPNSKAQAAAIRTAYRNAGIGDFNETGYLECHGTGTFAGDPIEISGVSSVFAPTRPADNPLIIGSVKSNIGHSEAAAGLSGLMKSVMAVERGIIPGNPTFITPNPRIDFEASKVKATRTAMKWPKQSLHRASVNSFGFGGANAHVVLESVESFLGKQRKNFVSSYGNSGSTSVSPYDDFDTEPTRPYLLLFSANDKTSLKNNVSAISNHLINPAIKVKLSDVAYTLSERRTHHFHRGFIATDSKDFFPGSETTGKAKAQPPKIGFVFTGQGAQWSQMGKDLIKTFPEAKNVIKGLDESLQTLPSPPKWSLLAELTQKRDPAVLRSPEFSQPLVTALQIAMLAVLGRWGIKPQRVIGHSSGEIAAAVAADMLDPKDAVKIAYLRGQAGMECPPKQPLSMLAVGVSAEDVTKYMEPMVHIACYNGPTSLTLSGPVPMLEVVRDKLQKDGHFARLLQVDLAYHSEYMQEIGDNYQRLLRESCPASASHGPNISMFSSVTGSKMSDDQIVDPEYWRTNMVSPVRFAQAAAEVLSGPDGSDFLVEVGPSNALAGPLGQVIQAVRGTKTHVQYTSTGKRGPETLYALFGVAGNLWATGGDVDISKVNLYDNPSLVIDLPNYQWNHSARFWWEDLAIKELRSRQFCSHDLLGSKMPGVTWETPTWSKVIRLSNLSWLKDHEVGGQIIFPAAGYFAMATEAIYQTMVVTEWTSGIPSKFRYRLKDIKLLRGLVLSEISGTRLDLSLTRVHASPKKWYQFKIQAHDKDTWSLHCSGLIRIDEDYSDASPPAKALEPLVHPYPGSHCYRDLNQAGYTYGPSFQKIQEFEWRWGRSYTRGQLSMEEPQSTYKQSPYPVHPVCTDSFLQISGFPIRQIQRTINDNKVLVPSTIESLVFDSSHDPRAPCMALTEASFVGIGRKDSASGYQVSGGIYDPKDGTTVLEMKGLRLDTLDSHGNRATEHVYTRFEYNADLSLTSASALSDIINRPNTGQGSEANGESANMGLIQSILNLASHQKPTLEVLEVHADPDATEYLWLDGQDFHGSTRNTFAKYHCISTNAKEILDNMQDLHSGSPHISFEISNITDVDCAIPADGFDFAIVQLEKLTPDKFKTGLLNIRRALRNEGQILLVGLEKSMSLGKGEALLRELGFSQNKSFSLSSGESITLSELPLPSFQETASKDIICLRFSDGAQDLPVLNILREANWKISLQQNSTEEIAPRSVVIVLDELSDAITSKFTEHQWDMLQDLVQKECNLLWVTTGAQMEVTDPDRSTTHGLLRVIRQEEPHLRIVSLDVERATGPITVDAISTCIKLLMSPGRKFKHESEFIERQGIIHTSRLVPDEKLNEAKLEHLRGGRKSQEIDIYEQDTCIRLRAERLGTLDALHYSEVSAIPLELEDEFIEVDVVAAGVNFKDVAITMGIVPGNEHRLGGEGAGIVRRVGAGVSSLKPGQRVTLMYEGSFANRMIAPCQCAYPIPDWMSFEQAAALPVAYLTSLFAFFDLSNLQKGHRVLIHSATGGVGNTAIQLCQYMGAEVFATVGTDERRRFLEETMGIPSDHIFSSRTTDFEHKIMQLTEGYGVDIILNSVVGELLEASWNIIAHGGTMIEIGKKDIGDHNRLSMEPFKRCASYRAMDIPEFRRSRTLISRLFKKVFDLLERGCIKPIFPLQVFPFDGIRDAFLLLRSGKQHIGKLVISRNAKEHIKVPVRPAPRALKFRDDACYLIVGGLKGLCGSLAVELAKFGVKHLAVLSRSGYDNEASEFVLHHVRAIGCQVDLLTGDVSVFEDVKRAFAQTTVPIGGIIQGAMVLLDRPFSSMTSKEYHAALACKVQGTWNLHNAALEQNLELDFFTMLSSISSVLGTKAQANYVAGSTFLDSFASYRNRLGLPACTVNLGIVEHVGYMAKKSGLLERHVSKVTTFINEVLLSSILQYAILQQSGEPVNPESKAQMVTGINVPQPDESNMRSDARFDALFVRNGLSDDVDIVSKDNSQEVKELNQLLRSKTDPAVVLDATVVVVSNYLTKMLRLTEPIEPERPLSTYGIDSLAAVEFRNWLRLELGASVTMMDTTTAPSLIALCHTIVLKIQFDNV